MNTGQMMLTIAAMIFVATMVLNVNKGFNNTTSVLTDSKLRVLAVSEATSIFEEATSKAFDSHTDTTSLSSVSQLTPVSGLGLDAFENASTPKNFDDFDDYNCYKTTPRLDSIRIMTGNPKLVFKIFCNVCYVNDTNPITVSSTPTWHKKMDIRVTGDSMGKDTVKMSMIYSYWYFR